MSLRLMTVAMLLAMVTVADAHPRERHVRIRTRRGPLHVWTPAGYDPGTAATVVYVHGYFAHVDDAWTRYHLAAQFRASRLNALFIACEAPALERDAVAWPSLDALLTTVQRQLEPLPAGRVVAMGHSGAHRTIATWLDDPRLDTIALIDAGYRDLSPFAAWLQQRANRRLFDVGAATLPLTDRFHRSLPETMIVERFPPREAGVLPDEAASAQIVYVRARMSHMELVTSGVAIPMLLRLVSAPLVAGFERASPITS